ncbi:tetratricopeptide repeat protein, partial [Marinicella sediminis]
SSVWIWQQSQTIMAERDKALTEKKVAEEVTDFLVETFKSADPTQTLGTELTAGDILRQGMLQIEREAFDPLVKNRLVEALGDVYLSLADFDQAHELYQMYQPQVSDADADHRFILKTARLLLSNQQEDAAEEAISLLQDAELTDQNALALSILKANILNASGQIHEATALASKNRMDALQRYSAASNEYLNSLINLARIKRSNIDEKPASLLLYQEAAELLEQHHDDLIQLSEVKTSVAILLKDVGRLEEANQIFLEVHELLLTIYGQDHLKVANSLNSLGIMAERLGDPQKALDFYHQGIEVKTQLYGEDSPRLASSYYNAAELYSSKLKAYELSLKYYQRAFELMTGAEGKALINLNIMQRAYAKTLIELQRFAEAEQLLQNQIEFFAAFNMPARYSESQSRVYLAYLYDLTGETEKAATLIKEAWPFIEHKAGKNSFYFQLGNKLNQKYGNPVEQ